MMTTTTSNDEVNNTNNEEEAKLKGDDAKDNNVLRPFTSKCQCDKSNGMIKKNRSRCEPNNGMLQKWKQFKNFRDY